MLRAEGAREIYLASGRAYFVSSHAYFVSSHAYFGAGHACSKAGQMFFGGVQLNAVLGQTPRR